MTCPTGLCVAAALASLKDAVGDEWATRCSEGIPLAGDEHPAPIITNANIHSALREIPPSLSEDGYEELLNWRIADEPSKVKYPRGTRRGKQAQEMNVRYHIIIV
jgi:hypothetical protein